MKIVTTTYTIRSLPFVTHLLMRMALLLLKRLISVGLRHGTTSHSSLHWKGFYTIKNELESLIGKSIYRVLPDVEKSIYKNMEC